MYGTRLLTIALATSAVLAQDAARLQQQLAAEGEKLQQAVKAANYWQALSQKEQAELKEVLSGVHKATKLGVGEETQDATVGTRLTACLRTRDVVQMEIEKLQQQNAELSSKVAEERQTRTAVNETMQRGIAECEARANETMTKNAAQYRKLQQADVALQAEHEKLRATFQGMQRERDALQKQAAEMETSFEHKAAEMQKQHEQKMAEMAKQHAKVMEAHKVLKKAHEVLQKRHDEMEKLEQRQRAQSNNYTAELKVLRADEKNCQEQLAASQQTQKKMEAAAQAVQKAALEEGTKLSNAKWEEIVRNVTTEKNALQAKLTNITAHADEQQRRSTAATRDIPEMEVKLRQCRHSREKTELDMQKILEKCKGKKDAFLQMQMQVQDWP